MKLLVCEIEEESTAVGFDQNMRNKQETKKELEEMRRDNGWDEGSC